MISAIIPTYRMPDHLDVCLRSAVENKCRDDTEIIVVVDGYPEESQEILDKYDVQALVLPQNQGMQYALNVGVMNASNEFVFILNDDNVFGTQWDKRMVEGIKGTDDPENTVLTMNQVEPAPGIFNFVVRDFGKRATEFRYDNWLSFESLLSSALRKDEEFYTTDGRIFPFTISKRWYMAVGGFDTFYKSPFWCDVDFWLKLEITKQLTFLRYHGAHLYHFGSIATKNRGDAESELFKRSEGEAAQSFLYKWGFIPNIVDNAKFRNNMKSPLDTTIKGIRFK